MADWKMDLDEYFTQEKKAKKEIKKHHEKEKKGVRRFMKKKALPAFEDLKDELKQYKRDCEIDEKKDWAALVVRHNKKKEFVYQLSLKSEQGQVQVYRSVFSPNEKGKLKLFVEGNIPARENSKEIGKIERIDIITDFLETYKQAARLL